MSLSSKMSAIKGGSGSEKKLGIYRGVVEDNNDSEKRGRCKVRVQGIHSDNKNPTPNDGASTDDLPWAEPAIPIIEGGTSGFGMFGLPVQGSSVFVFFEDGNDQKPKYFAGAPGKPGDPGDSEQGGADPSGTYPLLHKLGEPDYHKLMGGDNSGTIHDAVSDNRKTGITTAGGGSWDEPTGAYAAEYPHNIVIATHTGIVIEIDSTPGAQRVFMFHPSGTYFEINKDGRFILKNESDRFELIKNESNKDVGTNENTTVGTDATKKVGNDYTLEIGGNLDITVSGNINMTASGDVTIQGSTINLN